MTHSNVNKVVSFVLVSPDVLTCMPFIILLRIVDLNGYYKSHSLNLLNVCVKRYKAGYAFPKKKNTVDCWMKIVAFL